MSTQPPTTPFWFKQRQGKLESVGDYQVKVTAPNQNDAYVLVRQQGGLWSAGVRSSADGPDSAATPPKFNNPFDAWEVAFELYRQTYIT